MLKWEYKTWIYCVDNVTPKIKDFIDGFGADGWEMISAVPDAKHYVRCFFKRELKDKTND